MSRIPTNPVVKGKDVDDFIKAAAVPTNVEMPLEQKMQLFKSKGYARITIEIRAESGGALETKLVDTFNVYLKPEKLSDDTTVLQNHLRNFIPQIGTLVEAWLKEMKQ